MNLGKQIDSLLKRYSSVHISGLGVFQKIHTPATFDSKRNVFLPPITYIEFDHFGTEGYDFLAYWQQLEQLDREDAALKLQEVVSEILNRIQQDGEFILDNLGSFVSYGNSFVFKPLDLSGFLYTPVKDDFYQLIVDQENLVVKSELQDNQIAPVSEASMSVPSNEDALASNEKGSHELKVDELIQEVASVDVVESKEEFVAKKKESSSYIYGIVAVLAILALAGIYYYATLKPERTLVENTVTIESLPVDSNQILIDTAIVEVLDTIDENISVPVLDTIPKSISSQTVDKTTNEDRYAIVIGTHKVLEMALEEAKSYNKKGHKSVRVLEPNMSKNLKRVIWDTYPTIEKRDSALRVVRKLYKEDAWGTEI